MPSSRELFSEGIRRAWKQLETRTAPVTWKKTWPKIGYSVTAYIALSLRGAKVREGWVSGGAAPASAGAGLHSMTRRLHGH